MYLELYVAFVSAFEFLYAVLVAAEAGALNAIVTHITAATPAETTLLIFVKFISISSLKFKPKLIYYIVTLFYKNVNIFFRK